MEPWFGNESGSEIGEVLFDTVAGEQLRVKFIFAEESLSVQVHPDGNTEMWHVLSARPNAKVAAGFGISISEEDLRRAAGTKEIVELLEWYPAAVGDTFLIPSRTVHTIGEGLARPVLCAPVAKRIGAGGSWLTVVRRRRYAQIPFVKPIEHLAW